MLGLPKGEVFLVPWNEQWEEEYLREKDAIQGKIAGYVVAYHHIGSTAVKNLSAKPIIDIAIELRDFQDGYKCVEGLGEIGYKHRMIDELPERHYFSKGEPRTHQIHMYERGNEYLKRQLAFRDHLRNNESVRKEYQRMKETLSKTYGADKLAYADAKADFVSRVLSMLGFKT
ncbi:MAG: GrpB family protein [Nitrososphaera sp.]